MLTRHGISQRIRLVALAFASALFGSLVTGTALEAANQPNMVSARQSLRQVLTYLNQATPEKGGIATTRSTSRSKRSLRLIAE
jgi:hypothetical protein